MKGRGLNGKMTSLFGPHSLALRGVESAGRMALFQVHGRPHLTVRFHLGRESLFFGSLAVLRALCIAGRFFSVVSGVSCDFVWFSAHPLSCRSHRRKPGLVLLAAYSCWFPRRYR
jgi:hypothetical protein